MTRIANKRLAQIKASEVLRSRGMDSPPIDPWQIAAAEAIEVKPSDRIGESFSGCLMRRGEQFGILYSATVPNEGFQRFTVAHELGHYFLVGQHPYIFGAGPLHASSSDFSSSHWYEREADHFAAELLMPKKVFRIIAREYPAGLGAVLGLSERFKTSLTSCAIRYAETVPDPVAVIVSRDGIVDYCFVSEAMHRMPGIGYGLRKGSPVPVSSATGRLTTNPGNIEHACRSAGQCHIAEWFQDASTELHLSEDVIGLGSYGRVLTVLFTDAVPEEDDAWF